MFRFFLLLFLTVGVLCSAKAQVNEQDSLALVALYESTNGDNWINNDNWLTGPVESWYGVEVDGGRVVYLFLNNNGLEGALPTELGLISFLQLLYLQDNALNGTIPASISNLGLLGVIDLANNVLSGNLPVSLSSMPKLNELYLENNLIAGSIPSQYAGFRELVVLNMANNQLSGSIPLAFQNNDELYSIQLSNNQLTGNIPSELGEMGNIGKLDLSHNELTGSIPTSLFSNGRLRELKVNDNELSGTLPGDWSELTSLNYLDLSQNNLTGSLPLSIGSLTSLSSLLMRDNNLSGQIPLSIGDLVNLRSLDMSDNGFDGAIPINIINLQYLGVNAYSPKVFKFDYSDTGLCAPSFDTYNEWLNGREVIDNGQVCELNLSLESDSLALVALYESTDGDNWINNDNWLTGPVESWFGITVNDDFRVSHLNMNSNRLIGSIPNGLGQLTELTSLLLSSNELTGEIPDDLGNLSELYELSLSRNYLSGVIPSSLGNLTKAVQINISGNQLEGNVPENIFLIDGLSTLWVGNNPLSGPLPAEVTLTTAQNMTFFNTDLCIPSNQSFELWCDNNYICHALKFCDDPSISTLDSLNLVYIYENLGGENWTNSTGWLTAPVVQWHGITVANGSVTEIDLSDNNLVGELVTGWVNGVNYTAVDLSGNDLSGQLPTGIGDMYSLMNLNLSATNLEGKIPSEIIYSRSLTHLDFSNTSLCEPTTVAYINFTQGLQEYGATVTCDYLGADVQDSLALMAFYQAAQGLSWRRNDHWLDTPVHEWYGVKLDGDGKVISLELSANTINGQLPTMLPILLELDQLEILNLQDNLLIDGPIPNSIDGFTNLRILNLSYCQLGGSIPVEIGNMTTLEVLGLSGNNLYDEVPASIYSLSKLQALAFDGNNLHGLVPEQVSDLTELSTFVIYDNPLLCEPISSDYLDWAGDLSLYINSNTCAAPYGDFVKDSLALIALYESTDGDNWTNNENWLTGDVDTWYGVTVEDGRVIEIVLDSPDGSEEIQNQIGNNMIGVIPIELYSLTKLKILDLSSNDISGSLSNEIENLSELRVLDLFSNDLSGGIPKEVFDLESLEKLQLVDNNLSGTLPPSIGDGSQLNELLLAGNQIAGSIPLELGNLSELTKLSLGFNDLEGVIPTELGSLTKLETLFLGNNRINGPVPAELGNLNKLERLEISNNDLSGSIPLSFVNLENLGLGEARIKFDYSNTNLCEPLDQAYQDWKEGRNIVSSGLVCSGGSEILTFSFDGQIGETVVDTENAEISITMPFGTDLISMVADFSASEGATLETCDDASANLPSIKDAIVFSLDPTGTSNRGERPDMGIAEWTHGGQESSIYSLIDFDLSSVPANAQISEATLYLYNDPTAVVLQSSEHSQLSGSNAASIQRITSQWEESVSWNGLPSVTTVNQGLLSASTSPRQNYEVDVTGLVQDAIVDIDNSHGFLMKMLNPNPFRSLVFATREHPITELRPYLTVTYLSTSTQPIESGVTELDYSSPVCVEVTASDGQTKKQWIVSVEMEEEVKSLYTDSLALVALYESTDGDNWTNNDNWLTGDIDTWYGVTVKDGRVTQVRLGILEDHTCCVGANNLSGQIPMEIGSLSMLEELILNTSNLTGSIPSSLGQLEKLKRLDLMSNQLSGSIPSELGGLINLDTMKLGANNLTGNIPAEVGDLISLKKLDLHRNQLSGHIPIALSNLLNLTDLNLSLNNLEGQIPIEFGMLTDLQELYLYSNNLTGSIPAEIGNLHELKYFSVGYNSLSGHIPIELFQLSLLSSFEARSNSLSSIPSNFSDVSNNLKTISLGENEISGSIPTTIKNFTNLETLSFEYNELIGEIPDELTNMRSLKSLSLKGNSLTGYLPEGIYSMTQLERLDVGSNQLVGSIPSEIGNLTSLYSLGLSSNSFEGELPSEIGNLTRLYRLYLGDNNFTGTIPTSFGNLVNLDWLYLSGNVLSGELPSELGNLTKLERLGLQSNDFKGLIPLSFVNLANLALKSWQTFDYRNTNLCEPLDQIYQDWKAGRNITGNGLICDGEYLLRTDSLALVALYESTDGDNWTSNTNWLTGDINTWHGVTIHSDRVIMLELNGNNLNGSLPAEIGDLTALTHLSLEENNISGSIPTEVGFVSELQLLYMHTNELSGSIPQTFGLLSNLEDLHLASNSISGNLPPEIGNMSSLRSIDLGDNELTGEIPKEISQLALLENLVLNRNYFSGAIPPEIGLLTSLDYFSFTDNNLSGTLPDEIGDMSNLRVFDIENNNLSGELPVSMALLDKLERVYLSRNQLTGTVPRDFLELELLSDLSIIDNLFDSLPNVSATKPDLRIIAHTNKLTFADIEPNISLFDLPGYYSPQLSFGQYQTIVIAGSSEITLSQAPVGGTANSYQWYKDNELIEGATEEEYQIENPSIDSEGTYILKVTNNLVPGLTLESHPIELIYEPRTEKSFLSYSVSGEFAPADIDESGRSITVYLPCDASDIATPSFELSGGAQAFVDDEAQVSGVTSIDLSEPVDYTVIAEDGSESLWTITVANPNPIEIFSTIYHLSSCNTSNGSITLDSIRLDSDQIILLPNGRYSLQWSNASTGHQIEVTSEGNYSVEVTDNETGCSYNRSFDVLTKDLEGALSLRVKRDNTSCGVANGFISVDANIGSSQRLGFAWYNGTTASGAVIGLTKAIDNLEAGSYTLVVTDLDSDCTTSLTETIEDAQQTLDISLKSRANKSCKIPAGTVELTTITVDGEERTSTLGYRIEWSQTEDIENVLAQTREVNGLASGTYYARLIGVATACTSPVRSITVVDDQPSLNFNVTTAPNSRCDDTGNGSATLTSLPENHQIRWYRGETLLQGKTSSSINALTSGSYMAVVTDKTSGCEATSTFEIETATSAITLEVASNENTSCGEPTGEARVVAVLVGAQRTTNLEAFSFEWWLPNEEARLIQGRTSTLSNVLGDDYFVQVTLDSIGCQSAPLKTTVEEDIQNFAVALTQSRSDLPGAQGTGQLQVEILEQPEEYTISWYEGDLPTGFVIGESTTLDNVNEGLYTIRVTDQRTGCEVTATFEVGVDERQAQEISFDLPEIVNIADLPLTLEATSGQGLPVSFTVVEGQGTISQNQLTAEAKGTIVIKAYNEGTTAVAYAESIRTVKVVSDFYLAGTVTGAADGSQVSGEVVVFTLDGEVFAQSSFTDGSYFIDGLPEGKYRLLIEVTGAFNALAFDTYYNRQLLWQRATILTINDDTEVNVELIPKTTSNMTGTGSITGRVVRTDGGSRIVVGRTLDGTPLADVDIYLYDRSTNDVVAQSKTDDDGVFLFDNIPSGQYYFRIDAVGFEIADLGADIDYGEEEGTLQISAALGQEGLTVEYVVVSGVEEALLKDISIYPNPVQNILHVEDALNRIRSIQFLNLTGQLTRTFEANLSGQYDISLLTNGMYMMRIELEGKQFVHSKVLIRH